MPVKSSSSRVLRWPDAEQVHTALTAWADALDATEPGLQAVGYMGSYARGDWGPGSDVDIVVVLDDDPTPPLERLRRFDTAAIPVPADLLVFTTAEFRTAQDAPTRFARVLRDEVRWVRQSPAATTRQAIRTNSG
jgi:uncharacterized protein